MTKTHMSQASTRSDQHSKSMVSPAGKKKLIVSRKKLFIIALLVIVISAAVITYFILQNINQAQFAAGSRELEEGNYKTGYNSLKTVDLRGGTAQKNSEKGFEYYLTLARAAYLAGDRAAAKAYAVEGIKRLPPENSKAYFTAQSAAISLVDIRDGDYIDSIEYQAGMPLAGESKESE